MPVKRTLIAPLVASIVAVASAPAPAGPAFSTLEEMELVSRGYKKHFAGRRAYDKGDYAEASKLYREGAEFGNASSQYELGSMYFEGEGVPQDYAEAIKWFRLSAENGDSFAQYALGFAYAKGKGVSQDHAEAIKWYRLAAEQGEYRSQLELGMAYAFGEGAPRDFVQAHKWCNLAAANSSEHYYEHELHKLAVMCRDAVAAKMAAAEVAEAQRLAREWKPKVP